MIHSVRIIQANRLRRKASKGKGRKGSGVQEEKFRNRLSFNRDPEEAA
jgi:hypothetical protein